MTDDPELLKINITSDSFDANSIMLFMSDAFEGEVLAELDRAGLNHSAAMMHSADPQLVLQIVELTKHLEPAALIAAITGAVRTVLRRNDGKSFSFTAEGVSATGTSVEEMARMIEAHTAWRKSLDSESQPSIERD